jgi:hypothetical protein
MTPATDAGWEPSGLWATKWICIIGVGGSLLLTALTAGGGLFSEAAKIKSVALPCVYVILFVCALRARKGPRVAQPGYMVWVPMLVGCLLVSTVSAIAQRTYLSITALAQDWLMLGSMAFASLAALHISGKHVPKIVEWFSLTGIVLAAIQYTLPPFSALIVPAVITAFFIRREYPESQLWSWMPWIGLFLVFRSHFGFGRGEPSGAITLQYATCIGILLLIAAIRRFGIPFAACLTVAAAVIGGVMLLTTSGQQLAGIGGEVSDVTIKQRLYEMDVVQEDTGSSPFSTLFGLGPGSTIDLRACPDAETLKAAGRHLSAVDDVHLLTASLLMKLGYAGLMWIITVLACLIAVAWKAASDKTLDRTSIGLVVFLIGFVAYGAPAATNYLANPLFGFFFGLAVARLRTVDGESGPGTELRVEGQAARIKGQAVPSIGGLRR